MSKLLAAFAFIALLAASCSQEKIVAGTDTGNPVVVATLQDSNGTPLAEARVVLYRKAPGQIAVALDTLRTDQQGHTSFCAKDSGNYVLEAIWKDSLGIMASMQVGENGSEQTFKAGPLVTYTLPANGKNTLLAETGRQLNAGSTTRLPPGLWELHFKPVNASDTKNLPALKVQIDDARNTPEDLSGLSEAAQLLLDLDIKPGNYTSLLNYPTDIILQQKLSAACKETTGNAPDCSNGQCRIWSWESDWQTQESNIPVNASAITRKGSVQCVVFTDATNPYGLYIYTLQSVEKQHD